MDDAALPSLFDARANEGLRTLDVVNTTGAGKSGKSATAGDKNMGGGKNAGSSGTASNRVSSSTVGEPVSAAVPTAAPLSSSTSPPGSSVLLDAEEAADMHYLCGYGWDEEDCAQAVELARRLIAAFSTSALARLVVLASSSLTMVEGVGGAKWTARRWSALALLWCGTRWRLCEQAGSGVKDNGNEQQLVVQQHTRESILSYLRAAFFPPTSSSTTKGVDDNDDVMAEGESLSSIFPETFTHTPLVHHNQQGLGLPQVHVFSLRLTRVSDTHSHPHPLAPAIARVCSADTTLEVFVLMGAPDSPQYPLTAPIALLSSAALRTLVVAPGTAIAVDGLGVVMEGVSWSGRRAVLGVQEALWGEADRHVGDPQVCAHVSQAVDILPSSYPNSFLSSHIHTHTHIHTHLTTSLDSGVSVGVSSGRKPRRVAAQGVSSTHSRLASLIHVLLYF